jgi:hypothetical protein
LFEFLAKKKERIGDHSAENLLESEQIMMSAKEIPN